MQKTVGFEENFYFWACFADLPVGGLKKRMRKRFIKKKEHSTFPAVSWQAVHIWDTG